MNRTARGFTIVELLIVIVVIGILAAITIVAFNGIQARAENSKTVTAVGSYAEALAAYATLPGVAGYPIASYPCLGVHTTPAGTCANVTDGVGVCNSAGSASTQVGFDTEMKRVLNSIPQPSLQSMNCNGKMYSGAWYNSSAGTTASITYYLKGDIPCPVIGGTVPTSRYQANDTTACYTSLPAR